MGKVCESLGLAVNLKVKLESICAEVFSDYQMSVRDLFYLKNRDLSKSDHVCGSESCHEQRRLLRTSEKELMLLIRLEKVTKPSLKSLDSTNPQSDRLCTNGGNSRPLLPSREVVNNKDHSKAERVIVWEVAKVPRVTSKQLNFLTLANVNVHEPTIRRTLSNHGVHGRQSCKKKATVLQKENCLLKITWTSQRTIGERFNGWMKPK